MIATALGKYDQGLSVTDGADHHVDGTVADFDLFPVDQQRVERTGHVATNGATFPIVGCRHWPRECSDGLGQ